ncbi:MAG: NHL repeat-containing protein [Acidobacteriota bacterium]
MRYPIFTAAPAFLAALLISGCALTPTATPIAQSGPALRGTVHGGRQPISGASVYLYAAGSGGSGGASVSLLNANVAVTNPTHFGIDTSLNYYVVTDATGHFDITNDYTCTPGQPVYIYSIGGDPGSGSANSAAGLAAILGVCPAAGNFAAATPNVIINEVTTVAAAYAFAGFATDATHVSGSSTALGLQGIRNAFTNAANLVDLNIGRAYTTTPHGNNTVAVPQQTIYTLANILASCVNSTGPSSPSCSTIFSDVLSSGASGSTATETTTAAIYIAHNPGINVPDLFSLAVPSSPFNPAIPAGSPPNDFTLALTFNDFSINNPTSIAIDANGNAWVTNYSGGPGNSVAVINGATTAMVSPAYPATGYTGGGLSGPVAIAIDQSGNAWVTNSGVGSSGVSISELKGSDGSPLSPSNGYTGGNMLNPIGIAVDASGFIWVGNGGSTVTQLYGSNASGGHNPGDIASGANGYTGGGINAPQGVAIDNSGYVWLADVVGYVSELYGSNASGGHAPGDPISPSGSGYTNGGDLGPTSVAIDANGYVWTANGGIPSVSQLYGSNAVTPNNPGDGVSGNDGYSGGGIMQGPSGIAIDGVGNVWVANDGGGVAALYGSNATAPNNPGDGMAPGVQYTSGGIFGNAEGIAVDGSGNVWVADGGGYQVVELVGAAYPVVTPLVANLLPPYTHPASLP